MGMDRKKMLFIYNPNAGKKVMRTKLSDVIEIFMDGGYEVTIYATKQKKDAYYIIKERGSQFDYIVCSGGDGTLSEVTDGIMTLENRPPCGYIPSGTVNDFASSLHIPKNVLKAAQTVVDGEEFPYDVGYFNGDYYNYIAAFGAFTEVAYETPQSFKNILGKLAYFLDGATRLASLTSYFMTAQYGEEVITGDFIFGMVSNSDSVGGFKGLAGRNVELDDGLFEVALIRKPKNILEFQTIINALLTGNPDPNYICSFRTDKITFEAKEEVCWTLDGEFGGSYKKVEVINYKQAIRYIKGE